MLDLFLFIVLGALTLGMAVLGGVLTSNDKRHQKAFILMGVASLVLIVWTGVRMKNSSDGLNSALEELKRGQQSTDQNVAQIAKNTSIPPNVTVNMPATPKPRAVMEWAVNAGDNGISIFKHASDESWYANMYCKNVGTVLARNVACGQRADRVPADAGVPTDKTLMANWNAFSKKLVSDTPPHKQIDLESNQTIFGSINLNMSNVDPGLIAGKKVILVLGVILYSDDNGTHRKERCLWLQPPFDPPNPVWHYCSIGHNGQVY